MKSMRFTRKKLDNHIKKNVKGEYNAMVEISALYLRIYGELPKIGLSGQQAVFARDFEKYLPQG